MAVSRRVQLCALHLDESGQHLLASMSWSDTSSYCNGTAFSIWGGEPIGVPEICGPDEVDSCTTTERIDGGI